MDGTAGQATSLRSLRRRQLIVFEVSAGTVVAWGRVDT